MPEHIFLIGFDDYDAFERVMNRITVHNEIADLDVLVGFDTETELVAARLLLGDLVLAEDRDNLVLATSANGLNDCLDAITSTLGFTPTSFRRLRVSVREQRHLDLMQAAWPDA